MDTNLMNKIEILCDCDLKMGISPKKVKLSIKEYAEKERYEVCAGLKKSLDKFESKK